MIIIKTINTRIQNKHDIESNWLKAINFIPKDGEIIIYDIDENYTYPRLKIGNGIDTVNNLPFMNKIDSTLTMPNQAADAKAVGDALAAMNYISASDDGTGIITLAATPLIPSEEAEF